MGGTYNNNIIDGKEGFTDNSIVATLGYVKHQVANSVGDGVVVVVVPQVNTTATSTAGLAQLAATPEPGRCPVLQ